MWPFKRSEIKRPARDSQDVRRIADRLRSVGWYCGAGEERKPLETVTGLLREYADLLEIHDALGDPASKEARDAE